MHMQNIYIILIASSFVKHIAQTTQMNSREDEGKRKSTTNKINKSWIMQLNVMPIWFRAFWVNAAPTQACSIIPLCMNVRRCMQSALEKFPASPVGGSIPQPASRQDNDYK